MDGKGLRRVAEGAVRLMKIYIEEEIISISHIVTARTRGEARLHLFSEPCRPHKYIIFLLHYKSSNSISLLYDMIDYYSRLVY
jgi:hypothetical protein